MKRLAMLVAVGAAMLLGAALPAWAQFSLGDGPSPRQPAYNVSFNGQMRFIGVAWDNLNDFTDTRKASDFASGNACGAGSNNSPASASPAGACKDSRAQFFERLRWWLTIESADKKAKIVWNAQVGDLTLGNGNGVSDTLGSTNPGGGSSARVGTNAGGAEGARGVNMQQRQIYIAFDPQIIPNSQVVLGIQYLQFLDGPANEFYANNNGGIRFDTKLGPVDFQVWYAKLSENDVFSADDNEFYAGRVGVSVTPDIRVTVEGLVGNWQCFNRRPLQTGGSAANTTLGNKGTCVSADFAEPFWVGSTVNAKIAGITLYGSAVYGERPLYSCPNAAAPLGSTGPNGGCPDKKIKEKGYGFQVSVVAPIGPLSVTGHAWYARGDKARIEGNGPAITGTPCVKRNPVNKKVVVAAGGSSATDFGEDCSGEANTTKLTTNSDKLPVPGPGSSWGSVPYIADFLTGNNTVGGPTGLSQPFNADLSGTWGVGGAVSYALTPAFNLNGGVAYLAPTETSNKFTGSGTNSFFGDSVVEIDVGPRWTINTNLSMQGVFGYMIPDKGDNAWGGIYRFIYFF